MTNLDSDSIADGVSGTMSDLASGTAHLHAFACKGIQVRR